MKRLHTFIALLATTSFLVACSNNGQDPVVDPTKPVEPTKDPTKDPTVNPDPTKDPTVNPTPTPTELEETLPPIDYVKVFAYSSSYTHVYAWLDDKTELLGKWPGTQMSKYDEEWNTYDFKNNIN